MTEPDTPRYETVAVLYVNDNATPALVEALTAPIPDADTGAHFTRVAGDGPDTGWAYAGLDGSTLASLPHVFVVACRCKTTDLHAFLASLPWGPAAGVCIFNGTDKAKVQVNVLGRWAAPMNAGE